MGKQPATGLVVSNAMFGDFARTLGIPFPLLSEVSWRVGSLLDRPQEPLGGKSEGKAGDLVGDGREDRTERLSSEAV